MGVCEVCKTPTPRWRRCDEHYRCDDCGSTDALCAYTEGVLCEACHTDHVNERIRLFNGDTSCTDEVVCPHCGYEHSDSWECSDHEEGYVCDDCGHKFTITRDVEVTYSTVKSVAAYLLQNGN